MGIQLLLDVRGIVNDEMEGGKGWMLQKTSNYSNLLTLLDIKPLG